MNGARERILARIRRAQGRGGSRASQAELESVETYLRAHPRGPLPDVGGDLVARFRARAESMQSTSEEISALAEAPAAAARYLKANGLPASGCVWPALSRLDWQGAGLAFQARGANADDPTGITGSFAALAETGTLMLVAGPEAPASVSLLPETHIAIVHAHRILPRMEEAWDLARRELRQLPRAVNFISGPSRTGDIEQQLVLGAHGPYRVHIVIVRG